MPSFPERDHYCPSGHILAQVVVRGPVTTFFLCRRVSPRSEFVATCAAESYNALRMSIPATISRSGGPVRVALVAGENTIFRSGRVIRHLTVGLVDEPLSVTLVAPQTADLSALPCPPVEVLQYPIPIPWRFKSRLVEPLAQQLVENEVEVLHALDVTSHRLTRSLSEILDLPYVVSVWSLYGVRQLGQVGSQCRGVLAASAVVRTALQSGSFVKEDLIHIVRPGVHQGPPREQKGAAAHSRAIIAAGRFEPAGPFEAVIRAFADLRGRGYDCVLFLLGEGPAEHHLRQMAASLGLMHQVTFVDPLGQTQLPSIIGAGDIFVYPRCGGMLELELLEAMAAGVPALVGDLCVGDFAIEGQTTISYLPMDPADLAAKLKVLLDDPASAASLADRARRYLRENHSPARMVAATAELYRTCALSERTLKLAPQSQA